VLVPVLFSCFLRGMKLTGKGEYDEAFGAFTEGLSLAERVGDEAIHHRLLNCLGWLYADLGNVDRAEEHNPKSPAHGRTPEKSCTKTALRISCTRSKR